MTLRQRAGALFPLDAEGRRVRWRIALSIAFVLAAAALSLARQGGPGALDSIWAEDGSHYQFTFNHGAIHTLFTPVNGYLLLVQRVVLSVIALFPIAWAAALMAIAGGLASSACAVLVFHASATLVPSRAARLCFAVPMAILPFGESEVGNNVVNIQWYLIYTAFWMALWNPRTRVRRALAAAVLFAAVGSDPLALAFLPLLAIRLWSRPLRESRWQLGGVAAGVLFQGIGVLRGSLDSRPPMHDYSAAFALHGYLRYVSGTTLVSSRELAHIGLSGALAVKLLGLLAVLTLAAAALLVNRAANRPLAAICAAFSLGFFCLVTMQGGSYNDRYAVPPLLLLITALAVLSSPARLSSQAEASKPAEPPHDARWTAARACLPLAALCVLVGVNVAANYSGGSQGRTIGPSWSSQLAAGRAACRIPGTRNAHLQTAPVGWIVKVPCSRLLGGGR
ncbi:hypothetical protein [Actinocrinis sp.]|uniref:hypothetical protein n=1 Tax=Actinocrinis sp. TaxID=1920516 RepID=UPI002D13DADD|nr:hypothetical protein [Actinocrinis sp.]HXR72868.1 hypothetical protein [Actinocrinis sp.]